MVLPLGTYVINVAIIVPINATASYLVKFHSQLKNPMYVLNAMVTAPKMAIILVWEVLETNVGHAKGLELFGNRKKFLI